METYRVTAEVLNFRSGPGTASPLIGKLVRNMTGEKLGADATGGWIRLAVQFVDGRHEGWASAKFLALDEEEPPWLAKARAEMGVKEVPGPQHNPRIVEYHKSCSCHSSDEIAWCSSFTNWCLEKSGIVGTRSAAAISWSKWTGGTKLAAPKFGCITVLKRKDPHNPNAAHVAFFLREQGSGKIELLGGNQSNMVKVSAYAKADLIGYYWPKSA